MATISPESILQVANGFMAAKHLFIANEIGLFEALSEAPLNLDELAHRLQIPRRTARIVIDAMVALGFVERREDQYQNTAVADTYLTGRPETLFAILKPA